MIELGGCCEKKNTYFVFPLPDPNAKEKPDFKNSTPLFKCKEKSSCYQRHCLPADCRGFEMKIKQYDQKSHGKKDDSFEKSLVMKFDRPCKWTCLCINRFSI